VFGQYRVLDLQFRSGEVDELPVDTIGAFLEHEDSATLLNELEASGIMGDADVGGEVVLLELIRVAWHGLVLRQFQQVAKVGWVLGAEIDNHLAWERRPIRGGDAEADPVEVFLHDRGGAVGYVTLDNYCLLLAHLFAFVRVVVSDFWTAFFGVQ
jgi:hypothetical protein